MINRRKSERRVSDVRRRLLEESKGTELANLATLGSLAHAIEARDPYTRGHSERVGTYSSWMANEMRFSNKKIQLLRYSCRLHDIGKISIPDKILLKPDRLSMEERAQIELHPVHGADILKHLRFFQKGLPPILHHHERYDGKGYPYGLRKEEIPLEARIVAVADAFDAMVSDRPYRKALPMDQVKVEIKMNLGKQFDPQIGQVFLALLARYNIKDNFVILERKKAA